MTTQLDNDPHFHLPTFIVEQAFQHNGRDLNIQKFVIPALTNSEVFAFLPPRSPAAAAYAPAVAAGFFAGSTTAIGGDAPRSRRLPRIQEQCEIGGMAS